MFCDELTTSAQNSLPLDPSSVVLAVEELWNSPSSSIGAYLGTDAGMEIIRTADGALILGSEDSDRFNFGFYFYDPTKDPTQRVVSIHDCLDRSICDDRDAVGEILLTYIETGDLGRRYNWSLNELESNDTMYYDRCLKAGDKRPLSSVLSVASQAGRWGEQDK